MKNNYQYPLRGMNSSSTGVEIAQLLDKANVLSYFGNFVTEEEEITYRDGFVMKILNRSQVILDTVLDEVTEEYLNCIDQVGYFPGVSEVIPYVGWIEYLDGNLQVCRYLDGELFNQPLDQIDQPLLEYLKELLGDSEPVWSDS